MSHNFQSLTVASLICLSLTSCLFDNQIEQENPPLGQQSKALLGGVEDHNVPLAFVVDQDNQVVKIPFPSGLEGEVKSVAIDEAGLKGVIGGHPETGGTAFAYSVNLNSNPPSLTALPVGDTEHLFSTAISAGGERALFGGASQVTGPTTAILFAADLESETPMVTQVPPFSTNTVESQILSVALNKDGTKGLVGGVDISVSSEPKAYSFNWEGENPVATELTLHHEGIVNSVAIDASGTVGLIGGKDDTGDATAYQVKGNITTPITLSGLSGEKEALAVAINRSGTKGIIGGYDSSKAHSFVVDLPTTPGTSSAVAIVGLPNDAQINSVAIDTPGVTGLIGGYTFTENDPIAYVVDIGSSSIRATLNTQLHDKGTILAVEIQDAGEAGIIGGSNQDTNAPVAFLVTELSNTSPTVTPIQLGATTANGEIKSVSFDQILNQMNHIPLAGLSENNLSLAKYLNENASSKAAYFIPSHDKGSALEKVSPIRNIATLFSADNTFFSLSQCVSQRARDSRQFRRFQEKEQKELAMLAAKNGDCCTVTNCPCEIRLNDVWGEVIGLFARQDKQDQTIGFDPTSVGALIAYDTQKTQNFRGGIGLAYAYTSLDYDSSSGNANVNQEYITLYGLWNRHGLYANIGLWFGLFQTNHERKMPLTGFDFRATSFTSGYQFDPHLEIGVNYDYNDNTCSIEPFVGVDWIHNWQSPYTEYSSSSFKYFFQNLHSSMLRTEAGLRLYQEFGFSSWNLVLQEALSYIYKDTYSLGNMKGFLVGAPGTLILNTFTSSQEFGSVGFSMLFDPKQPKYPSGRIGYKGEFGSDYRSHQVNLNCEWSF